MASENVAILKSFSSRVLGEVNPPRTAAQLAAYTAEGLTPHAIHVNRSPGWQEKLVSLDAPITGISLLTWGEMYELPKIVAEAKKAIPNSFVVVGGVNPTLFPEMVLKVPGVDGLVMGYGDQAWQDITGNYRDGRELSNDQIPGFYLSGKTLPSKPERLFSSPIPLKQLKQPDYEALTPKLPEYFASKSSKSRPNILFQLGCANSCVFCINTAVSQLNNFGRAPVEFRSPAEVVREIQLLMEIGHQEDMAVFLAAPDSLLDWEYFKAIIVEDNKAGLSQSTRYGFDTTPNSLFKVAQNAGASALLTGKISLVSIGVDSLSAPIQTGIGNKFYDSDTLIPGLHFCADINALPVAQMVLGFPGDNQATLTESLEKLIHIRDSSPPFVLNTHCATACRGTPLFNEAVSAGLINPDDFISDYFYSFSMPTRSLSLVDLTEWKYRFLNEFYTDAYYERCQADTRSEALLTEIDHFYQD